MIIIEDKWKERDNLRYEGHKLYAEGDKLYAEGDLIYVNAVIATYGKTAIINWETGEIEIPVSPLIKKIKYLEEKQKFKFKKDSL